MTDDDAADELHLKLEDLKEEICLGLPKLKMMQLKIVEWIISDAEYSLLLEISGQGDELDDGFGRRRGM